VIQRVAREELRKARENGHCGCCDATAEPGKLFSTLHNRGCKAVNDAGIKRRPGSST
jgi:hypothetical protein